MKSVKFIKPWKIYSPGDIAGFEPELAQQLVDGKVAQPHEAEAEKPAEGEAKPTKTTK